MSEFLDGLNAALEDRYRIERQLGEGGMATVYLAEDLKHERNVAIKVFRPELTAEGGARFLREIRIIAQLQHPNILTLIDSGKAAGRLFYVMPHVKGDTLRTRLVRERQLSVEVATRIGVEIADALALAHRHGVYHRDIKPENVMLAEGHAMVADFGIAHAADRAGRERITETGFSLGTPEYMSPEQASGEAPRDGRGDIYSLGCVIYEMLVGVPPFTGPTSLVVMARHATDPVPSLQAARRTTPLALEQAVLRALQKAPVDRFETAGEFRDALRDVLSGSGRSTPPRTSAGPPRRSVAVLPFTNMSADPDNEYFSDGVTEDIINALAQLPSLRVTARSSAFSFKDTDLDVREVGKRLGVSHVLEGSVRRMGKRLRITAQLVDISGGFQVWSERFDRELEDVFEVQDEIASEIAKRLRTELTGELAARERRAASLEAYDPHLRGRFFLNKRTEEAVLRAIDYFEKAHEHDPDYAPAAAGLAAAHLWLSLGFGDPETAHASVGLCQAFAEEALELDPTLAEAHVVLGCVATFHTLNAERAEEAFGEALALNPNHADALYWRSHLHTLLLHRYDLALSDLARARELDPLRLEIRVWEGYVHYFMGDIERAVACHRATITLDPHFAYAHYALGDALTNSGEHGEALEEFGEASRLGFAGSGRLLAMLGFTHARNGEEEKAREYLTELEERSKRGAMGAYARAVIHAGLGERGEAMDALEEAVENRETAVLAWIPNTPELELIRDHPRYEALLERIGFVGGW